jgi:hypothetical protein
MGRDRARTQPIFSHLWNTDMSFSFKWTKNWSRGRKTCINSSIYRYVPVVKWHLVGHYLSPCSSRVLEKMLSLSSLEGSIWFPWDDHSWSTVQPYLYR